jgi:hypothetical protein
MPTHKDFVVHLFNALPELAVNLAYGEDRNTTREELRRVLPSKKEWDEISVDRADREDIEAYVWNELLRFSKNCVFEIVIQKQSPTANDQERGQGDTGLNEMQEFVQSEEFETALRTLAVVRMGEVIDEIRTFPARYQIYIRTPFTNLDETNFGSFHLVRPEGATKSDLRFSSDSDSWLYKWEEFFGAKVPSQKDSLSFAWPNHIYALFTATGFIPPGRSVPNSRLDDAAEDFRAFIGLCTACGLIDATEAVAWEQSEPIFWVDNSRGELSRVRRRWFSPEESARLGSLAQFQSKTDQQKAHQKRSLHGIASIFRNRDKQLLSAGAWFFRSLCGSDELLRLVQMTTTLEILLGDEKLSKKAGITELLASRGAYLIATSRLEREELFDTFKRIYDVRSRAVHAGENRLRGDSEVLGTATSLCIRAIEKEVSVFQPV